MLLLTNLVSFISPWLKYEGKIYLQQYYRSEYYQRSEKNNNKALISNHIVAIVRGRSSGMTGLN